MVAININSNVKLLQKQLGFLTRRELPFAVSKTVNSLAYESRDKELGRVDQYFQQRTPWISKKGGMPVERSHKKQWPEISATIGIKSEVMALAAIGGHKSSKGGSLAVPFSDAGSGQSTRQILNPAKETLPRNKWPSKIVKPRKGGRTRRARKPKPFYMQSGGQSYVVKRTGKARAPLQFLYSFKNNVTIPKQWPIIPNVQSFVSQHYASWLERNLDKAVRTSKK